ncbi:uncharacterized protein LOC123879319 [Maniola jurtina]|uniref:uncharacterized protein LOC123879319 n=1 Tax=Maniola jurtina TaxID=191418 RepID=UPI001E68963A|nr:uncharacterized protein LOC123879319 [Maniola jurtina]
MKCFLTACITLLSLMAAMAYPQLGNAGATLGNSISGLTYGADNLVGRVTSDIGGLTNYTLASDVGGLTSATASVAAGATNGVVVTLGSITSAVGGLTNAVEGVVSDVLGSPTNIAATSSCECGDRYNSKKDQQHPGTLTGYLAPHSNAT